MRIQLTSRGRLISLLLVIPIHAWGADPAGVVNGQPDEQLNRLFRQETGWIGGDGGTSVQVGPGRIVWLFSDTFVGEVRDGKRTNATMVNNTAAIQTVSGPSARVEFFVRRDESGEATALITPADAKGFFWIHAAAFVNKRLLIFLVQVVKDAESAFGFREVGRWLGVVGNPLDAPTAWRIRQHKIPHTRIDRARVIGFGAAALRHDGFLYTYGVDEHRDPSAGPLGRFLVMARVPIAEAEEFLAWRFYSDGKWVPDYRSVSPLTKDVASENAVIAIPGRHQFALVYSHLGYSEKVQVRTAPQPWGPWSLPHTVYECPEMQWDKRNFCYGAKAHAGLTSDRELVLTYFTNSTDFWHVAADPGLYVPKFVRVPWESILE